MNYNADSENGFCGFCGKSRKEVHRLIGGPNAYICDKCVLASADLIENDDEDPVDSLEERRRFFRNVYFIMETDSPASRELCSFVKGITGGLRLVGGYDRDKIGEEIPDQPA